MVYKFTLVDSLSKIFPDSNPSSCSIDKITLTKGELFNFQLAYNYSFNDKGECFDYELEDLVIEVDADETIKHAIKISKVELVNANLAIFRDLVDDDYLFTDSRLCPDLLVPLENKIFRPFWNSWRSLWIEIKAENTILAGEYPIEIRIEKLDGQPLWSTKVNLSILDIELSEQKLIYTNWFHADCLANYYEVDVFSQEHWKIIENFIKSAANNGVNMLLTPIFTPPLDTEIGGERRTTQLVKIAFDGEDYKFDFTNLDKWIKIALDSGIKYFEMSHLFTQWGAKYCPKILANINGKEQKIFSWETSATSKKYEIFLNQFLPELIRFLKDKNIYTNTYFHISDEPSINDLESYKMARELVRKHIEENKIIDALSDIEFYKEGVISRPIPSNDHIEPFLEHEVIDLWTYYCCAQGVRVSNRFMSMPSSRNRIIGVQLYKHNIVGFLHWGFNFYNSQFSRRAINPYVVTDADNAFPSGDAFAVYPGQGGIAYDSIRSRVFYEALQDIRKLNLLEKLSSRDNVNKLICQNLSEDLTFRKYPKAEAGKKYLLELNELMNEALKSISSK